MKFLFWIVFQPFYLAAFAQMDSIYLKHEYYTLPNGLQVVLQPDPTFKSVSVEFWIKNGTSIDLPDQYGLQHFFEHVMPFGPMDSVKRNKRYELYLEDSNAQVRKDYTRFYLEVISEGLELALERVSGRLKVGLMALLNRRWIIKGKEYYLKSKGTPKILCRVLRVAW